MSDNSLDWASVLGALSDSDELMSLVINDVKVQKPVDDQVQESSKILLQPAMLPYQNIHVTTDVEPAESSYCQSQNLQTRMITNGGSLINPLGFPYRSQKQVVPAAALSGSCIQSSQELLMLSDMTVNIRGKEKTQEATGVEEKKQSNKIKNRISAAKSRAKKQEHTKFLEEKVEQLKNENAHLKKLLFLDAVRKMGDF